MTAREITKETKGSHPRRGRVRRVPIGDGESKGASMTRVLVVDDDPDMVAICSLVLESEGYNVEAAMNGCEAMEKISTTDLDVVLLDVMMPAVDGLTVCRMAKTDPRTRDLPIIIMSASEGMREKSKGLADAVLTKPFDIDHLLNTVGTMVAA